MLKRHTEEQSQSLTHLTVEELAEFRSVHEEYQKILFNLGTTVFNIEEVQTKLNELNQNKTNFIKNLQQTNEKRLSLIAKLGDKYGDKQVDMETGELK